MFFVLFHIFILSKCIMQVLTNHGTDFDGSFIVSALAHDVDTCFQSGSYGSQVAGLLLFSTQPNL